MSCFFKMIRGLHMTRRRIIAMDTGGLDRRIELIKVILEKADTCDTMNLCFIKNYGSS